MSVFLLAWAVLAAGYTAAVLLRLRRREPPPSAAMPVLLLRPVDAPTAEELRALARPVDHPGVKQVVLAAEEPAGLGGQWLPSDPSTPNRKVGHWLNALTRIPAKGRVVVSIDADVEVDAALIDALVAPIASGAALVSAAPVPAPGGGWGARALLVNTHHNFLALDALRAGASTACGKAVAFGPAALREMVGLAECVGEDLELAARLHQRGERVELAAVPARTLSATGSVERFTRWMRVLRAHRPALTPSVPLLFAPTLPLLLLAPFGDTWARSAILVLVVLRVLLSVRLEALSRATQHEGTGLPAALCWLLGEALLLLAFLRSLRTGPITWRGQTFTLGRGGAIQLKEAR
jgi:ceramide glucosyltransferase